MAGKMLEQSNNMAADPQLNLGDIFKVSGPAYCDFIAFQIHDHLMDGQRPALIASVDPVKWDLHPTGHWMLSTKKTINVTDINGRRYRVTVEEV